jgi:hypothetical protein
VRRIGLFVEGKNLLGPHGRDGLRDLWHFKCAALRGVPSAHIDVHGFIKDQLEYMAPKHAASPPPSGQPKLDVLIEVHHRKSRFDRLIVAFDAHPANQAAGVVSKTPCLRLEKDFVLECFAKSAFLPAAFRTASAALLTHYRAHRGQSRAPTRPPIGDVELVFMEPTFEAAVLQDAAALRRVFGLASVPAAWPRFPVTSLRPDFVFRDIVNRHRRQGPLYLRTHYDADKHAWAREVLRNAGPGSKIWQHEISQRLDKALS